MKKAFHDKRTILLRIMASGEFSDTKLRSMYRMSCGKSNTGPSLHAVMRPMIKKGVVQRVKLETHSIYILTPLGKKLVTQ